MKVAINSRTFRVVYDDGKIIDYKIDGGATSSHLLNVISGGGEHYVINTISKLDTDTYEIKDDTYGFSFFSKSDVQNITKINYVDVEEAKFAIPEGENDEQYGCRRTSFGVPNYGDLNRFKPAGGRPVIMTPPPPRKDFTETEENYKNFGELFGK